MEATITIICGTLLAISQAWIQYRLKQQDNIRDAARDEMKVTAEKVKAVAVAEAERVKQVIEEADRKLDSIHVLVNSRMTEALDRVQALESKLGLAAGEEIPSPQTVTEKTKPEND